MAIIEDVDEDAASLQSPKEQMLCENTSIPANDETTELEDEQVLDAWDDSDVEDDDDDDGEIGLDYPSYKEHTAKDLYEEIEDAQLSGTMTFTLDLITWSIPFLFIFEILSLLVQKQYNEEFSLTNEIQQISARMPPLIALIAWNLCEKRRWLMQSVMFVLGTLAGCYMAYLVNRVRMSTRRP